MAENLLPKGVPFVMVEVEVQLNPEPEYYGEIIPWVKDGRSRGGLRQSAYVTTKVYKTRRAALRAAVRAASKYGLPIVNMYGELIVKS